MNAGNTKIWDQKQKKRQKSLRHLKQGRVAKHSYKGIYSAVLLFALASSLIAVGVYFYRQYARNSALEFSGSIINVKAGGDLQVALNRAKAGDTIVLQAGAKYVGSFGLPNKAGNEFVTIQSSELAKLPADGTRVSPSDAALMPKILSSGRGESAVYTLPNAHHYRFVGIEFAPDNKDYIYNLVALGAEKQTAEEVPHHIEIDRCYLHPNPHPDGRTRRGIALNSAETVIKNSYLAGFAYQGEETQAIAGWNGTGGYKIINNYLAAGAENILFGGADPSIKNLVPTDIEIRNNLMTKPLEWRGKVSIKCTFELKNARNVRIVGNIIENGFDEMAVRLTIRNQEGNAPWSVIEDVLMENNWIRNSGGGINFLGTDDINKSAVMKRVQIVNNLFTGIDAEKWGGSGRFILITNGEDITVANNTVFNSGSAITAYGTVTKGFTLRGNIFSYNQYGFTGDGVVGNGTLTQYFPGSLIAENLVMSGSKTPKPYINVPLRNYFAADFNAVGFVNWQGGDYRLAQNSKYKNRGSNKKDLGADIDRIEAEIKKAR
ncbi:MAG: hypothetical protein LH614_03365 [Pyrinomonadaceae bacterium]|nr:hypothetical protein [Pyrinomonadaceae bacterium]